MLTIKQKVTVQSLAILLIAVLLNACASTEALYAEYEHQCRVSIVSNASGTVVVEEETGKTLLWEPAVYFNYDRNDLLPIEYQRLDANVKVLAEFLEMKVDVRGFTDDIASDKYNNQLATQRVATVVNYLLNKGISSERIVKTPHGKLLPLSTNETLEGRSINRRVELVLLDQSGRAAPVLLNAEPESWTSPNNISQPGLEKTWNR